MSTTPDFSPADASTLVCHCQRVPYETVQQAIDEGRATSLADLQAETTACTRCFGCRFELERMLEDALGSGYVRAPFLRLPQAGTDGRLGPSGVRRRMYLPVLSGFRGYDVRTRVILFNWPHSADDEHGDVELRADLHAQDGTRHKVWNASIGPRRSAIIEIDASTAGDLDQGIGVLKLVVDTDQLGSLRPYFHLLSPGGLSTTHEKAGVATPDVDTSRRRYFWIFPVAASPFPEEAYFFATNTAARPLAGHELVWRSEGGAEERVPLPELGLDQTACVPLHQHFPAIGTGRESGTVRLSPSVHVAGFILRHDPRRSLWRVQHL
jgi:bacterioferritin-associated ferredoxin